MWKSTLQINRSNEIKIASHLKALISFGAAVAEIIIKIIIIKKLNGGANKVQIYFAIRFPPLVEENVKSGKNIDKVVSDICTMRSFF